MVHKLYVFQKTHDITAIRTRFKVIRSKGLVSQGQVSILVQDFTVLCDQDWETVSYSRELFVRIQFWLLCHCYVPALRVDRNVCGTTSHSEWKCGWGKDLCWIQDRGFSIWLGQTDRWSLKGALASIIIIFFQVKDDVLQLLQPLLSVAGKKYYDLSPRSGKKVFITRELFERDYNADKVTF